MLKLVTDRPLAIFDIEATGVNPRGDRIVDLAIVVIAPDGSRQQHSWRFNPERPIPPEATAIHGIHDADVKFSPRFRDKAQEIARVLNNCDLAGYNLIHYDIPMLTEEFIRAAVPFTAEGRRVIDAQKIFHKREPRDLSAALRFYCNELHLGAHGAIDDVLATIRVIEGQFEKYKDLPRDIAELDRYCNPRDPSWIDTTGKLKWADGEVTINFGRYAGRKLRELAKTEPNFLKWMLNKSFPRDVTDVVADALKGKYPAPPAAPAAPAGTQGNGEE
jgi:DNA polymerase-3 subunit epsilon